MSNARSVIARSTARFVDDAAAKVAMKQARNQLITYSVKKIVGELEGKAVGAGLSGFSLGRCSARRLRWRSLPRAGATSRPRGIRTSASSASSRPRRRKPTLALNPDSSWLTSRAWNARRIHRRTQKSSTSAGHWEGKNGKSEALYALLFRSRGNGRDRAVLRRGQDALLSGAARALLDRLRHALKRRQAQGSPPRRAVVLGHPMSWSVFAAVRASR